MMDHAASHFLIMSERLLTISSYLTYCLLIWMTRFVVIKSNGLSNSILYKMKNADECTETCSILLTLGETKSLWKLKPLPAKNLTFIVAPCSSKVSWSVRWYLPQENTTIDSVLKEGNGQVIVEETSDSLMYVTVTRRGFYVLALRAVKADTRVFLRSVEDDDLPPFLQVNQSSHITIENRRKGTLTFHWSPSVLDPKWTDFCVVVNTRGPYHSFCAANEDKNALSSWTQSFPDGGHSVALDPKWKKYVTAWKNVAENPKNYFQMKCKVGKNRRTFKNFTEHVRYFVDIFYRSNNVTYNFPLPYASKTFVHQEPSRLIKLRDGKVTTVDLTRLHGKAVFKYKTSRSTVGNLTFVIIPCKWAAEIEVSRQQKHQEGVVQHRAQITNAYRLTLPHVQPHQIISLKISYLGNFDNSQHSSNIEVLASTNSTTLSKFPVLPASATVYEFKWLRTCRSVTVGWVPVKRLPSESPVSYCVYAFRRDPDDDWDPSPDQCKPEARTKDISSLAAVECHRYSAENETNRTSPFVMTRKINRLRPNFSYSIQVVVKVQDGRSLSYDRLAVQTRRSCKSLTMS
ncbi:unnamed protein product [Bemisia tabaci]|uniref:Protein NDNF n=1 Tax=Bemisia tabaci TaxID=7038 RepID=A0A9P0A583_BEMTA|nr:unnamed protein product [Bemisia tabaci]